MKTNPTWKRFASVRWEFSLTGWLALLLALSLAATVGMGFVAQLSHNAQAQEALAEARNVKVAAVMVAMDRFAYGLPFADQTQKFGLDEAAYREIMLLSKVPGDLYLLRTDSAGYAILAFRYVSYEYNVIYEAEANAWQVAYYENLISIKG